jgi:NDP-sugar pyrophosphorylase family protein
MLQAGVDHVVLAVNYRAEVMEKEMRKEAERVRFARDTPHSCSSGSRFQCHSRQSRLEQVRSRGAVFLGVL